MWKSKKDNQVNSQSGVVEENVTYAGFWWRLVAFEIDLLVVAVCSGLFALVSANIFPTYADDICSINVTRFILFVFAWLYYAVLEVSAWRGTLGKKICGLSVEVIGGGRITFLHATFRFAFRFISALIIFAGFVIAAFTEKKQALHDKMTRSLVLRKPCASPFYRLFVLLPKGVNELLFKVSGLLAAILAILGIVLYVQLINFIASPFLSIGQANAQLKEAVAKTTSARRYIESEMRNYSKVPADPRKVIASDELFPMAVSVYEPESGDIKVGFIANEILKGHVAVFHPQLEQDGYVLWNCTIDPPLESELLNKFCDKEINK